jgi:uncharacterized membrane protein
MHTPAKIAKHPIHPMLVAIPIGLWVFSLVCDVVYRFGGGNANWQLVAWYTMIGGIVGALLAAVPGFIDMLSLPRHVKRIALIHMAINLTVVALFVVNAWLRRGGVPDSAVWLSFIGVGLLAVSGWLGGHMVYVHGVAVEPERLDELEDAAYPGRERRSGASNAAYYGPERRTA